MPRIKGRQNSRTGHQLPFQNSSEKSQKYFSISDIMVGITIIKDSNSSAIPHLSSKKISKKPRKMNATTLIIIIFGLIGIIFGFMFLSLYIKTSCELDSLKKLIKSQENLSTTTSTASTTTTAATTTAIKYHHDWKGRI